MIFIQESIDYETVGCNVNMRIFCYFITSHILWTSLNIPHKKISMLYGVQNKELKLQGSVQALLCSYVCVGCDIHNMHLGYMYLLNRLMCA